MPRVPSRRIGTLFCYLPSYNRLHKRQVRCTTVAAFRILTWGKVEPVQLHP